MIFATVGGQTPFDRLIKAVDDWAESRGRDDVFAQIGKSELRPRRVGWTAFLDPPAFRRRVAEARLIVAHAGMGSILTALELGKPLLVLPRLAALHETRNEHQSATVQRFAGRGMFVAAADERELAGWLDRLDAIEAPAPISAVAPPEILAALRRFVFSPSAGVARAQGQTGHSDPLHQGVPLTPSPQNKPR